MRRAIFTFTSGVSRSAIALVPGLIMLYCPGEWAKVNGEFITIHYLLFRRPAFSSLNGHSEARPFLHQGDKQWWFGWAYCKCSAMLISLVMLTHETYRQEASGTSSFKYQALQATQPSSILHDCPAVSLSPIICVPAAFTIGSAIYPPCFSTVNCTACDAAFVRR